MEGEDDQPIRAHDMAMRAEIEVLRGAVAALRATRSSAVRSARDEARGEVTKLRATWRMTLGFAAFLAGVAVTMGCLAIYRVALCP